MTEAERTPVQDPTQIPEELFEEIPRRKLTREARTIRPRKVFSRVGLALVVWALAPILPQSLLMGAAMAVEMTGVIPQGTITASPWFLWVLAFGTTYLVGFPLCFVVLDTLPKAPPHRERLAPRDFFALLLMCFPVMQIGNLLGTLLAALLSGGQAVNSLDVMMQDAIPGWVKVLVLMVLAPLVEETVFRKLLLDRTCRYGERVAVIFSAAMFALFHMNLYQSFYTFGVGVLLAYVYIRTGRLRWPLALHMIFNFAGGALPLWLQQDLDLGALQQAGWAAMGEMGPALLGLGLYGLAMLGLSIWGLVLLIRRWRRARFLPAPLELAGRDRFMVPCLNVGVILLFALCAASTVISLLGLGL